MRVLTVVVCLLSLAVFAVGAEPAAGKKETPVSGAATAKEMASLVEAAPTVLTSLRRYPEFFGSPWYRDGGIFERSSLTGDWGGARKDLVDTGIYVDVSLTQVFQNVSGGAKSTPGLRYAGSIDYHISLDTGKAGIWPGGLLMIHGETALGNAKASSDAGTLIPVDMDSTMPVSNDPGKTTLSALFLTQALSPTWSVMVGKMNLAGLADSNAFANNERTQFMNTSLVNNPLLGPFGPYTTLCFAVSWTPSPMHNVAAVMLDGNATVTRTGFDTAFSTPDGATYGIQYTLTQEFMEGLPGSARVIFAYSTKDVRKYHVDRRYLLEDVLGVSPTLDEDDNYGFMINFDQYVHMEDEKQKTGLGLFGRAGWAPGDRNALDAFYSVGLGGKGCLIPGRDRDLWGLGWGGTHISSDLRDDLDLLTIDVDDWEHAFEVFYNFEVTPAVHLTLDVQYVVNPVAAQVANRSGSVSDDGHALVVGMRLQLDF